MFKVSKIMLVIGLICLIGSLFFQVKILANKDDYEWKDVEGGVEITDYKGEETDLILPDKIEGKPVVSFGEEAFRFKDLTSIILPKHLKELKARSLGNNKIKRIVFPEGVEVLGDEVTTGLSVLEYVSLPSTLTTIGQNNFTGLSKLNTIEFPIKWGVEEIKLLSFANIGLKQSVLRIPEGTMVIGDDTFTINWGGKIEYLVLPESLEEIGERMSITSEIGKIYIYLKM